MLHCAALVTCHSQSYLLFSQCGTVSWGSAGQQGWSCWSTVGPGLVLVADLSCYSESGEETNTQVWGGKIGLCVPVPVYVCVCSTVCVLILLLGAPDGCCNHYTSLHHQNMSAVSTEGSWSGRQMKNNKEEKGTEQSEEWAGRKKGAWKRSIVWKTRQKRWEEKVQVEASI